MENAAVQAIKKGRFENGTWHIQIGRIEVVVDFKTAIIAAVRDGKIIDKFSYERNYSLMDFGAYLDNTIESENRLNGFSDEN